MDQLSYLLAEHRVLVTGTRVLVTDRFDPGGGADAVERLDRAASSATVALELTGDAGDGRCDLLLGGRSQRDLSLTWGPDGRLAALSWKSTGAGAAVLSAGLTVLASVAGLGLRVAGVGALGGVGLEADDDQPPTPEQQAWTVWANDHQALVTRRQACAEAAAAADDRAAALWTAVVGDDAADLDAAVRAGRRLAEVAERARAEVARVDAVYAAWRATTIGTREEAWTTALPASQLLWGTDPDQPAAWADRAQAREVWDQLGVAVAVHRLDGGRRRAARPTATDRVHWRVPRPVRVDVWRRGEDGAAPTLTTSTVTWFVDDTCDVLSLPLDSRWFGEDSLTLTFGELGQPATVGVGSSSGAAAVAGALAGAPADLTAGLDAAAALGTSVDTLRDARGERRLAGLKHRLAVLQQEVALKAEAATADDVARLRRLEQRVAIAAAEGTLEGGQD